MENQRHEVNHMLNEVKKWMKSNLSIKMNLWIVILAVVIFIEAIGITYWGRKSWRADTKNIEKQQEATAVAEKDIEEKSDPADIFINNFSIEGELITLIIKGSVIKVVDETDYTWFISELYTEAKMDLRFNYVLYLGIKYEDLVFDKEEGLKIRYEEDSLRCISIQIDDITMIAEGLSNFSSEEEAIIMQDVQNEIKDLALKKVSESEATFSNNCINLTKKGIEILLSNFAYCVGIDIININGKEIKTEDYKNLNKFSIKVAEAFTNLIL